MCLKKDFTKTTFILPVSHIVGRPNSETGQPSREAERLRLLGEFAQWRATRGSGALMRWFSEARDAHDTKAACTFAAHLALTAEAAAPMCEQQALRWQLQQNAGSQMSIKARRHP